MSTDSLADMLTRIRNAQSAGHQSVLVRSSVMGKRVLDVLKKEGFIQSFEDKVAEGSKHPKTEVVLKYYGPHEPVISRLKKVSTPGRRVYMSYSDLPLITRGIGITVVSTSRGVMSDREARRNKVGGEVVAIVS
jgi:small subunit ribosomal protein S8